MQTEYTKERKIARKSKWEKWNIPLGETNQPDHQTSIDEEEDEKQE